MGSVGFNPVSNTGWVAGKGTLNTVLAKEALDILKGEMGFKGVKIVSVEKGIKGVEVQSVLKELTNQTANQINKDVARILGMDPDAMESVLVVVGGLELVKSKMKEIEKSLKKVNKKEIMALMAQLGIADNSEVLIVAETETLDGNNIEAGGLIFVQTGLREIEDSILEESTYSE